MLISVDSSTISLSFSPSEDNGGSEVTDYELWITEGRTNNTFTLLTAYNYGTDGFYADLNVTDIGLTVGNFYRFKYIAYNSAGASEFSNLLTVPLADIPATPGIMTVTPVSKTSVTLDWVEEASTGSVAGDIISYLIYIDNGLSGSYSLLYNGTFRQTVFSFTATGLITGRYYRYKFYSGNYVGISEASESEGYACIEPSGLAAPTLHSISATSVYIKWTAPTDNGGCEITGYELYRTNLAGTAYEEVHASEVNDDPSLREFNITDLPSGIVGELMRIRVYAKNDANLYVQSSYLEVTVAGVPDTPDAPTDDLDSTTNTTIGVAFTEPYNNGAEITMYEVQIDDGTGGDFTTFTTSYGYLFAQTSDDIIQGFIYRVRVRAANINGWSAYSDIGFVLAASVPDAPAKPTYVTSTNSSITLKIYYSTSNNGASITSHSLYIDGGDLTSDFTLVSDYDGTTQFEVTGLTQGVSYRFYTTATNEKGESDPSEEARLTVGSPPTGLRALSETSSTKQSISLSWGLPTDATLEITGYTLEINDGSDETINRRLSTGSVTGDWDVISNVDNVNVTSATVSNLTPGVLYRFRYRAYDENAGSLYSDVQEYYACTEPTAPGTPVVKQITLSSMFVEWTPPSDNGGCNVTEYKLYRNDGQGGAVTTEIHSSDLAGKPSLNHINVTEFPTDPIGLTFKFKVVVFTKFVASTGVESSESSEYLMALKPSKPTDKPYRGVNTNATQIDVSFNYTSSTNGASILSYHLQVDDGKGGQFRDVSGATSNDLSLSRIVTSGIVTGNTYRSRYRARNVKGYSSYSPVGYIEASMEPAKPDAPNVEVVNTDVVISWTLPDDRGNDINNVDVYILNGTDVFVQDLTTQYWNSITVPMSNMLTLYGLIQNDPIISYIVASNDIGPSEDSDYSDGTALVQVAPLNPPTVPYDIYEQLNLGDANYGTQVTIKVDELTGDYTGGSPITSYVIEYYSPDSSSWIVLGGDTSNSLLTQYNVVGLVNGVEYSARYRAKNIFSNGELNYSNSKQSAMTDN